MRFANRPCSGAQPEKPVERLCPTQTRPATREFPPGSGETEAGSRPQPPPNPELRGPCPPAGSCRASWEVRRCEPRPEGGRVAGLGQSGAAAVRPSVPVPGVRPSVPGARARLFWPWFWSLVRAWADLLEPTGREAPHGEPTACLPIASGTLVPTGPQARIAPQWHRSLFEDQECCPSSFPRQAQPGPTGDPGAGVGMGAPRSPPKG